MKKFVSSDMKRFNRLSIQIDSVYREAAFKLGLSYSEMMVLYSVLDNGGNCPIGEICSVGVNKQTVNSALRKLERESIVYLEAAGGRRKNVCLTEDGRKLAERTVLRIIKFENEIFASWSEEERESYLELTHRYLTQLNEKVETI